MADNQYMDVFIEESDEHIQNLNDMLLELENDTTNLEYINEMFRSAHTLKGMAGTMGFENIANLTHCLENVLDAARNNKIVLESDIIDVLFETIDTIEALYGLILSGDDESKYDITSIKNKLQNYLSQDYIDSERKDKVSKEYNNADMNKPFLDEHHMAVIKQALKQGLHPYYITIKLEPTCVMKGVRAYIIFKALEEIGEIIKTDPPIEDIEEENFDLDFSLIMLSDSKKQDIERVLKDSSELKTFKVSELDIEKAKVRTVANKKNNETQKKATPRASSIKHAIKSIRVDIDRLDNLMNLVSELIIIKNSIEGIDGYEEIPGMEEAIEYLQRVSSELHEAVMQVRMVPIGTVFNRFPRVVRDLSKQLKKDIVLNIHGEDTEVDRTIVDEIGDPLLHLIRNSLDHGIESPEQRIALGKESTGNIDLYAYHDGNNVVIEIEDDGQGIDIEKVKNKIIERELISEDEIKNLTEQEIIQYLFHPGFSTSEKVSSISGRGVGLDVVKTSIESLGGVIEVETIKNEGTKFTIRLPLTLSIIKALLVDIKDEMYAIPLSNVREVVEVTSDNIKPLGNGEVISIRGELMPFIRLYEVIDADIEDIPKNMIVVVVKKSDKSTALLVDDLIGQQDIVIKSLGKHLSNIKIFSGATILGDGSIALILDINNIV